METLLNIIQPLRLTTDRFHARKHDGMLLRNLKARHDKGEFLELEFFDEGVDPSTLGEEKQSFQSVLHTSDTAREEWSAPLREAQWKRYSEGLP